MASKPSKEAVEAAARALSPDLAWNNGKPPGEWKQRAISDAKTALTAALPFLAPQLAAIAAVREHWAELASEGGKLAVKEPSAGPPTPPFQAIVHAREQAKRELSTLAETVKIRAEERIAAVREHAPDPAEARNEWRETVRDIYDNLHFAKWEGLPAKLVAMIEKRHPDYFADAEHLTPSAPGPADVCPVCTRSPPDPACLTVGCPDKTVGGCLVQVPPDPADTMTKSDRRQFAIDFVHDGQRPPGPAEAMRAKCEEMREALEMALPFVELQANAPAAGKVYNDAVALKPIIIAALQGNGEVGKP